MYRCYAALSNTTEKPQHKTAERCNISKTKNESFSEPQCGGIFTTVGYKGVSMISVKPK